jgi:hypothetical protein
VDRFIFNYNVVLELDPSYEKYLINNTDPYISGLFDDCKDGLDEGELGIVSMMHNGDKVDSSSPFPYTDDDADDMTVSKADSTPNYNWILKPEYATQPLNGRKTNPLQLLPPTSVLAEGSITYRTPQIRYRVTAYEGRRGVSKLLIRDKFSESPLNNKFRLIRSYYWFQPVYNIMSEKKNMFVSLIYNPDTRRMYSRTYSGTNAKGPKRRYKAAVRSIAFNTGLTSNIYTSMPTDIYIQFIRRLKEVVLRDVPDAYVPHGELLDKIMSNGISETFINIRHLVYLTGMLALQHKHDKRIDWLDEDTFLKVGTLLDESHVSNYFSDRENREAIGELSKTFMNYRKYRLSAIRRCIRNKPGMKSFVKALFGKHYRKIAFTMMIRNIDSHDMSIILALVLDERMPKNIYHYIVNLLENMKGKNKDGEKTETLSTIGGALRGHDTTDLENQQLYTCLKTYKRFGKTPGRRGWIRWADMYRMADRLHVRVRPNKLTNEYDVDTLHDKLSEIYNRDKQIQLDYKDVVFEPLTYPDKEYGDGFKFVFLDTPAALTHEGTTMHHCVSSYSDKCIRGTSIIFSMRKDDRGYITIELDGGTYEIKQKYTIRDHTVENQSILSMIGDWHNDVLQMQSHEQDTYRVRCERKVAEQKEIRRKEAKKQLAEDKSLSRLISTTARRTLTVDVGDHEYDLIDAVTGPIAF